MPESNTSLTVPAYLLEALEAEEQVGTTDIFVGNTPDFPKFRRVIFPARTGKYAQHFGKIIIDGANESEREIVDHIDFLLVDNHVINGMTAHDWMLADKEIANVVDAGVYPRTYWEHDSQGRRVQTADRPQCTSSNGIDTWASNRGQEIRDYRSGKVVKIGFRTDEHGIETEVNHACIGCPLAEWGTVSQPDGTEKSAPPLCRQTPQAIIYDIDRQELLTVQGGSRSVALALKGSRGKFGRRYDNVPFQGIEHNFAYVQGKDYVTEDGSSIPTFRNRPEGKPSLDNPSAPVIAVRMTATLNNFNPKQLAPDFTLLDVAKEISLINPSATPVDVDGANVMQAPARFLTPDEYGQYLQTKRLNYDEPNSRNRMMGLNYLESFATDQAQAQALPAGAPEGIAEFDAPFTE